MQNFNNYNGYQQPPYYSNPYQQPKSQLIFVNGIEGAKSYMMQPNQIVMLLDSDDPIVYKKTSNAYGQASIECFRLVPIQDSELHPQPQEYVLKKDFDALLEKVNSLMPKEVKDNA